MEPSKIVERRGDPMSSRQALADEVMINGERMEKLMRCVGDLVQVTDVFTDTDLDYIVTERHGSSPGRNVVAKLRQQLEAEGYVERHQDAFGKPIMHMPHYGGRRAILGFYITPKGMRWLSEHL